MARPAIRSRLPALALLPFVLAACPKRDDVDTLTTPGAPDASSLDGGLAQTVEPDEEVHPVYPADAGPPDPIAEHLCRVLHDVPEEKRAACCDARPGVVFTGECVRVVTAALRAKAVTVDAPAIDACAAALDASLAGCEWPGPFSPELPAGCHGIVKGALPAGARCRSSLECAGDLRCHGVGPTATGRCGAAKNEGDACGGSADTLVTYARESDVDARHPECRGWCNRTKCAALVPAGGACALGAACGAGKLCVSGRCESASPAKVGEACPGGACEAGAVCLQGKCAARKRTGEACAVDFECVGGCLKGDGGARGVCGKKCSLR